MSLNQMLLDFRYCKFFGFTYSTVSGGKLCGDGSVKRILVLQTFGSIWAFDLKIRLSSGLIIES